MLIYAIDVSNSGTFLCLALTLIYIATETNVRDMRKEWPNGKRGDVDYEDGRLIIPFSLIF